MNRLTLTLRPRAFDLQHLIARSLQVFAQASSPAACALKAEDDLLPVLRDAQRPTLELLIACGTRRDGELPEQLPEIVERHREMAALVRVYPDCDHRILLISR
jgi:hypothetical protein